MLLKECQCLFSSAINWLSATAVSYLWELAGREVMNQDIGCVGVHAVASLGFSSMFALFCVTPKWFTCTRGVHMAYQHAVV